MEPSTDRQAGPDRLLAMPPLRAILSLAMPTTFVMAVAAASNVLSTWYVSRLGADAIAAVSLVFPISLLATTAMAGGLGAGAASAIARALGGGHKVEAGVLAWHALALSIVAGVLFGLGMIVAGRMVFALMGGRGDVLDMATLFAQVLFGGASITFVGAMFDSIMRGEGNMRVPAIWSSTSLVLQMLITPVLMFTAGLGLIGSALAVLVSQLATTVPRVLWVFGGRAVVRPTLHGRRATLDSTMEILRVGVPAALSTCISNLGIMVMTGVLARLGEPDLVAYGLGTRLDFVLLSLAYGFGAALLTLVGMAAGARRHDLVWGYAVRTAVICVVLLAIPGMILSWRPELWIGLFTDSPGIHAVGAEYFRLIGPSYPFMGAGMVCAFAFQALGRATTPLVLMTVRMVGVLAGAIVCTQWFGLGERSVFATIALGNVIGATVLLALFAGSERRRVARAGVSAATVEPGRVGTSAAPD